MGLATKTAEKAAVAAEKAAAAAEKNAVEKAAQERTARVEVSLSQMDAKMDAALSNIDNVVVSLERSFGERMEGLDRKVDVVQRDIAALPRGDFRGIDDRLAALQGAVVLQIQMGERMVSECAKEDRVAQLEASVARQAELFQTLLERIARQEEIAQARDANIQALLLRLIPGAGLEVRDEARLLADAVAEKAKAEERARLERELEVQEQARREKTQRLRREQEAEEELDAKAINETRKRLSELRD